MPYRKYQELNRRWRKMNRLFPDRGSSVRPWEAQLKSEIRKEIQEGLDRGCAWAMKAAHAWDPYGVWKE